MKYILPVLAALLLSIAACKKEDNMETNNIRFCPNIYAQYSYENNGDTAYCWVPNVFTPDGSGVNDLFQVYRYNIQSGSITVKEGNNVLFHTDSIYVSWDGYRNGNLIAQNNYDYIVNGIDVYGNDFTLTGTISVLDSMSMYGSEWINNRVNCDSCRFPSQWDGMKYDNTLPTNEYLDGVLCDDF